MTFTLTTFTLMTFSLMTFSSYDLFLSTSSIRVVPDVLAEC
jgi:hypothetical protein